MATGPWSNVVPLGKLTVATAGTTIPLSTNCGPLAGQVSGTQQSPNRPGQALRQIQIQADAGNTKNIYVLPRGKTLASNANEIIAALAPGQTVPIPHGISVGSGYLPENFVLDTDTNGNIAYGYGITG